MDRAALSVLLRGNASFLRLKENSKEPTGSFKANGRNRLVRLPLEGNYGVLPQGRLLILDVDNHGKGSPVEEQVSFFTDFLGVDLQSTMRVDTPSGGFHFYLLLPQEHPTKTFLANFPKTSLRTYQVQLEELTGTSVKVDADLRSLATNAYAVGPGSSVGGSLYRLSGAELLTLPSEGFARLVELYTRKSETRKGRGDEYSLPPQQIDLWAEEPLTPTPVTHDSSVPTGEVLSRLIRALSLPTRRTFSYHQKRAFVKRALTCCYTDEAIVRACVELEIDRDSHTGSRLKNYVLQRDIVGFKPRVGSHGRYCRRGSENTEKKVSSLSSLQQSRRERVSAQKAGAQLKRQKARPRALSLSKVSAALLSQARHGRPTAQYRAAMSIMESLFLPLLSLGAERVLVAQEPLARELGLTPSGASQALRLLRERDIIFLARRGGPGVAPLYGVNESYVDARLTSILWYTRKLHGSTQVLYSPRLGGFVDLAGEVLYANAYTLKQVPSLPEDIALPVDTFWLSYLRSSLAPPVAS